MNDVTPENKKIAQEILKAFGGRPTVHRYWDDDRKSHVDIAVRKDSPERGVTSYATIGLSDSPLLYDGKQLPFRLEIVGACGDLFQGFDNALGTAAFCIINSGWSCYPGAIFPDILSMYDCSNTMRHFFFVPPFLWGDTLRTLHLETKTVTWLLAVPISEEESVYAEQKGAEKLENLFEEKQIDIFNLERPSAV